MRKTEAGKIKAEMQKKKDVNVRLKKEKLTDTR